MISWSNFANKTSTSSIKLYSRWDILLLEDEDVIRLVEQFLHNDNVWKEGCDPLNFSIYIQINESPLFDGSVVLVSKFVDSNPKDILRLFHSTKWNYSTIINIMDYKTVNTWLKLLLWYLSASLVSNWYETELVLLSFGHGSIFVISL